MEVSVNKHEIDILSEAIKTYGIKNQEDIAIEEMSELTKAIIKHRRYNTEETKNNLLEEMADVQIMLLQMMIYHGFPSPFYDTKIKRLKEMLEPPEFKLSKPVLKVTAPAVNKTIKTEVTTKGVIKE